MAKATKITAEQLKRSVKLQIKVKAGDDVEVARKQLIKELGKKEVDGVDDDTLDELLDMYEAFYSAPEDETEEEEVEEEETEDETSEEADVDELSEEVEEEETEEVEAPKKKAVVPVKKTVTAEAKPVKKADAKEAKPTKKTSEKYTPWTSDDEDNKKAIKPLIKLFPGADVKYLKNGITIFHAGKSSKRAIVSFDRIKIDSKGGVVGDLFFNALKGKDEVHEKLGEGRDYKHFNSNLLFLSKLSVSDAVELLSEDEVIEFMIKKLSQSDTRAIKNREKLEEKISGKTADKKAAPVSKVATKAKAVVEEEEEEEEEVVTKKVVKTVAKKK